MKLEIDNTRRHTFATCPRKYYYRWVKHLVSKKGSSALRFGHVIHEGLACYYHAYQQDKNIVPVEIMPSIIEAMTKDWNEASSSGLSFYEDYRTLEAAIECVATYIMHYEGEKQYLHILKVEDKFTVPISLELANGLWPPYIYDAIEGINFIGRRDADVDLGGSIYVLEHKTTSTSLFVMENLLYRSAQTIGYAWALSKLYPDRMVGCMVNLLVLKAQKKRKDGTYGKPSFDFGRYPQPYVQHDYDHWLESLMIRAGQIAECYLTETWPMEFDSCYLYRGQCPYTHLCQQQRKLEDINFDEFVIDKWDPRD